jgi:hypothetical protein
MLRYMQCCPGCGAKLDPEVVPILRAHSFSCPFCAAPLRVASSHSGVIYITSLIFSVGLTLRLRFHNVGFALTAILGSGLIFVVLCFIIGLIRPAKLELQPPKESTRRLHNWPPK